MCLIEHCWLLVTSLLMETVGESTEVGSQPAMLVWEFVCWCLCGPFPLYMLICEIVYTLACVYPNICETECVCAAPCADALFVCPFLSRLGWHTVPQSSSLSLLPSLYCCPLVFPVTWLRCDTYSPLTPILHLSSTYPPLHPDVGPSQKSVFYILCFCWGKGMTCKSQGQNPQITHKDWAINTFNLKTSKYI